MAIIFACVLTLVHILRPHREDGQWTLSQFTRIRDETKKRWCSRLKTNKKSFSQGVLLNCGAHWHRFKKQELKKPQQLEQYWKKIVIVNTKMATQLLAPKAVLEGCRRRETQAFFQSYHRFKRFWDVPPSCPWLVVRAIPLDTHQQRQGLNLSLPHRWQTLSLPRYHIKPEDGGMLPPYSLDVF